jgi:hypothetical protein
MLFLTSNCLTKISILLFYRRLVDRSYSKNLQNLIYVAIGFTVLFFIAFFLYLLLVCKPVDASWKSLDIGYATPYTCSSRKIPDIMVGVISVFSDVYALIIPEVVVYRLRVERRKKIVLFALFGMGAM